MQTRFLLVRRANLNAGIQYVRIGLFKLSTVFLNQAIEMFITYLSRLCFGECFARILF